MSLFGEALVIGVSSNIFLFSVFSSLFCMPDMKSNSLSVCKCVLLYLSEMGVQRHSVLFAHMKLGLEIFVVSLKTS